MATVPPAHTFDLTNAALQDLHKAGFHPEFSPEATVQLRAVRQLAIHTAVPGQLPDLRQLPWSSIDNDTSRDLDQVEVASPHPQGIRLQVAIADVAAAIPKGSPLDQHAAEQTQTFYTAVHNFPMLPPELSTDLTSLNEHEDRLAVLMSFTVTSDGKLVDETVSRAWVRNRAHLAYSRVGPWLEGHTSSANGLRSASAPQNSSEADIAEGWLAEQLKLQDQAAQALRDARRVAGALDFHRAEADPVVLDGQVAGLEDVLQNRAMRLVEDLMVAANGVMARALRNGGRSGLQRVVRLPARWDRIVALAADRGTSLPATPDAVQLNAFLQQQRLADPVHYPDLALAVIKLMGPGEYVLTRASDDPAGHFGLAARDYTHSTAPNRRFPDLVTQRILHAMLAGDAPPYTDAELSSIAAHCNEADAALRKIDRAMRKRVAAVAMSHSIGQVFSGVVTGATTKGVYVRVLNPPFEGRILQGEKGLDVGDRVRVKLLHTDPVHAFIDFAKVTTNQPLSTEPSTAAVPTPGI